MTLLRLGKRGCLTVGVFFLAAGYAFAGRWWLIVPAGLVWLAGVAAGWSSIVFVSLVCLAAAGVCAGAWPPPMIIGATMALAGWDLASWEDFAADGLPAGAATRLGRRHSAGLALALGSGLLAALLGRMVSFDLPFGVAAALAVLLMMGMDQLWRFTRT
jgi:hypothetical protein